MCEGLKPHHWQQQAAVREKEPKSIKKGFIKKGVIKNEQLNVIADEDKLFFYIFSYYTFLHLSV